MHDSTSLDVAGLLRAMDIHSFKLQKESRGQAMVPSTGKYIHSFNVYPMGERKSARLRGSTFSEILPHSACMARIWEACSAAHEPCRLPSNSGVGCIIGSLCQNSMHVAEGTSSVAATIFALSRSLSSGVSPSPSLPCLHICYTVTVFVVFGLYLAETASDCIMITEDPEQCIRCDSLQVPNTVTAHQNAFSKDLLQGRVKFPARYLLLHRHEGLRMYTHAIRNI